MEKNLAGIVFRVKKYSNEDIEIGFLTDDDTNLDFRYFSDQSKKGELTKWIANTLAETLGRDVWAEISFDENGIVTSVELSELLEDDSGEE